MMTTPPLPEHLRPLIDRAERAARELIRNGGEISGMAFIDTNTEDPKQPGFVVIPMAEVPGIKDHPGRGKDLWRVWVQTIADFTDARFVMVVSEVWYLAQESAKHHDAILKEYGSLQNAPMSIEGIHIAVETHDGHWMALAPITKGPDGRKTFDALNYGMSNMSGRLVGLLGTKNRKDN
jgi:hypothetical protein